MNTPVKTSTMIYTVAALATAPASPNPDDLFARYYSQDIHQQVVASTLLPYGIFNSSSNILAAIKSLPNEYGEANWDGCDANPVSKNSIDLASRFVDILPEAIKEPDVGVDPDGFVCFEWYHDSENQCLITFSDDDQIFCNLVSNNDRHDKTYLFDDVFELCQKILKVAHV